MLRDFAKSASSFFPVDEEASSGRVGRGFGMTCHKWQG